MAGLRTIQHALNSVMPSVLTKLRWSHLSFRIIFAMCAGLLLPAVIGGWAASRFSAEITRHELDRYLNKTIPFPTTYPMIRLPHVEPTNT